MGSHGSEMTEQPVCFVGYSASDFAGSAQGPPPHTLAGGRSWLLGVCTTAKNEASEARAHPGYQAARWPAALVPRGAVVLGWTPPRPAAALRCGRAMAGGGDRGGAPGGP